MCCQRCEIFAARAPCGCEQPIRSVAFHCSGTRTRRTERHVVCAPAICDADPNRTLQYKHPPPLSSSSQLAALMRPTEQDPNPANPPMSHHVHVCDRMCPVQFASRATNSGWGGGFVVRRRSGMLVGFGQRRRRHACVRGRGRRSVAESLVAAASVRLI